ncbi:MAG: hypothetical protein JWN00_4455 [Actinomycetia bacterium]|nr:hypothetical protein [Actinomycetes bacterium]
MRIVTSAAVLAGTVLALGACRVSIAATTYHEDHSYGLTAGALTIDSNSGDLEIVATDAPTISVHERLNFTRNRRPARVDSSTRTVDVTQDPAAPHHVRATAGSGDVTVTKN